MSIHADFEARVVRAACLFGEAQVPASILRSFANDLPAEARDDVRDYMAETHRQYDLIKPALKPDDFAQHRGGVIDGFEMVGELNEAFGTTLTAEHVADAPETSVEAILAAYAEAVELLR